jgi:hypothetical protein
MSELSAPLLDKAAAEIIEAKLLSAPPMEIKYFHTFAPGVYVREAHIKAGMIGVGHEHKTKTVNIVSKGKLKIVAGEEIITLAAPCVFVSEPGVRKVAHFLEDTIFLNVLHNPTDETDLGKLEDLFVIKSQTFLEHEAHKNDEKAIAEGKL